MRRIAALIVVLTFALALGSGCAPKSKPMPTSGAPTAEQAAVIRTSILTNNPGAHVGVITAVLDLHPLAMVSEIEIPGLRVGDVVSILDGEENVVTHAKIIQILTDRVAIRFDDGVRMPAEGDIVVRF